jgi:hypothetical protein
VISIRPSGRNAIRHGSRSVVTWVKVKGTVASGCCAPALVWARAWVAAKAKNSAAVINEFSFFISILINGLVSGNGSF